VLVACLAEVVVILIMKDIVTNKLECMYLRLSIHLMPCIIYQFNFSVAS
jgi:hypothetical protein